MKRKHIKWYEKDFHGRNWFLRNQDVLIFIGLPLAVLILGSVFNPKETLFILALYLILQLWTNR